MSRDDAVAAPAVVPSRAHGSGLQPLRVAGVLLPVAFVVALQLLRPAMVDDRWPLHGDLVVSAVTVVATVVFGLVMFDLIGRTHAATLRQNRELAAVNRVLAETSQQDDPDAALATVVRLAGTVPGAAAAGICLDPHTAAATGIGRGSQAAPTTDTPLCVSGAGGPGPCRAGCPVRTDATVTMTLHGPDRPYGRIWVAPQPGGRLGVPDEAFLSTLAELAITALRHARLLENERGAAILAERDRIAREMHDSLAQVLGATHLRLRGLAARPELVGDSPLRDEVDDIADSCQEAYADVREAIVGLRATTRSGVTFLDSLEAYVRQFSRQSRIPTALEADTEELAFDPLCEVQVLRVVQEALTNVRKHAGASRAVVRVRRAGRATVLEVEDDGRGFDPDSVDAPDRAGFGMASMRERTALVDGQLTVASRPGVGTRVAVTIPETMRLPGTGGTGWRP